MGLQRPSIPLHILSFGWECGPATTDLGPLSWGTQLCRPHHRFCTPGMWAPAMVHFWCQLTAVGEKPLTAVWNGVVVTYDPEVAH